MKKLLEKIENKFQIRFPRTREGWEVLYWLSRRRCPFCRKRLLQDWALYDRGDLWCLSCGGIQFPNGFWDALKQNYRSCKISQKEEE